ncbi:hypothetical protein Nepgr_005344 [Nepenthes gracilis]|uniref:Uncharacterized protein n=1 Tax=Nepenthes gracilis TaxID=150966 RepID=A0AAD3S304_NEPGR|nr:hypothetical protein Nepgr_005344 [Nepenthes gracilis]
MGCNVWSFSFQFHLDGLGCKSVWEDCSGVPFHAAGADAVPASVIAKCADVFLGVLSGFRLLFAVSAGNAAGYCSFSSEGFEMVDFQPLRSLKLPGDVPKARGFAAYVFCDAGPFVAHDVCCAWDSA